MNDKKSGILLVIIAAAFWGISGVCASYLMNSQANLTSQWLVPYRLLYAGIILVFINFLQHKKNIFLIWKENPIRLLTFTIFGMTALQYSYFTSISVSNAGTATVLQQISIVLIMVYTCLSEKRKPNKKEILSLILAITGVFLLATHGNPKELVMTTSGIVWGLINASAVALYTIIPGSIIKKHGSPVVTGWAMLLGGILLQTIFKPWNIDVAVTNQVIVMVLLIIVVGTILPFTMYLKGVSLIGSNMSAMLSNFEPVVAALLSVTCLGVQFTFIDIIGAICILSTIFILAKPSKTN